MGVLHVSIKMKTIIYIFLPIFFMILIAIESCEKPDITDDPELAQELLSKSVDTLVIESHKYFLETDLSRNLMPGGPVPTKRKLVAILSLVNADSIKISDNISISKLYIINGSSIWTSCPHDPADPSGTPEYKLTKVSTDGPEWDTDIYVDVISEVLNIVTNNKTWIIAKDQIINALY